MRLSSIDPVKCPNLYAAVAREEARREGGWVRVADLRSAGEIDAAERLARKLLGVSGPPMSEETREKLRQYNEEHKEEIRERRKQERTVRRRTLEVLRTGPRGRR